MKIDVDGETEDLSAMLIGAERYALGEKHILCNGPVSL